MNLSPHFTLEELTISNVAARSGIDNAPSEEAITQLRILTAGLEEIRELLGRPVHISSGYRCPELNKAIGGAPNSQHMSGNAADFICPRFGRPVEICHRIVASAIEFDQLILEYSWVHVSFVESQPRGSVLTFKGGRYQEGIA